jgi:hypothetical protein
MTATDTVIPGRSTHHQDQRPAAADTTTKSPSPAVDSLHTRPAPAPGPGPRGTRLPLGLAAAVLAAAVAVALTTLVSTVPDQAEVTVVHGPTLTAGIVGMSSAVLGLILTVLVAIRSDR